MVAAERPAAVPAIAPAVMPAAAPAATPVATVPRPRSLLVTTLTCHSALGRLALLLLVFAARLSLLPVGAVRLARLGLLVLATRLAVLLLVLTAPRFALIERPTLPVPAELTEALLAALARLAPPLLMLLAPPPPPLLLPPPPPLLRPFLARV